MKYIGDIILVLVLAISVGVGIKKGFLGLIVGLLSGIAVLILATLMCAPAASLLAGTGLSGALAGAYEGIIPDSELFTQPLAEVTSGKITEIVSGLNIPAILQETVVDAINTEIASIDGGEIVLGVVIIEALVKASLTAIAWISLVILLSIVFFILKRFVRVFNKIPIIGPINKLLGAVTSLVLTAIFVCVLMYLFVLLASVLPGPAVSYVENSILLGWIYDNNPIAMVIVKIFG